MAVGWTIRVKRVYEPPSPDDGRRILVDRLWPRGTRKDSLRLDSWAKDVAPSDELRRAFCHDPRRWAEFKRRYFAELDEKPQAWRPILEAARQATVTLLYAARDAEHNNALALQAYLGGRLKRTPPPARAPATREPRKARPETCP